MERLTEMKREGVEPLRAREDEVICIEWGWQRWRKMKRRMK